MKKIALLFIILFSISVVAQNKKITKIGVVTFEASVASFEEIKATNQSVTCILNTKTGEIASLALIKGFRFKIALMEEHFNENYIESDQFPKSTFKGTIQGFNPVLINDVKKDFKLTGTLQLHGKSKIINTIATLRKVDNAIEIVTDFKVNAEDFNIKIPSIVSNKVSKIITINSVFLLK